MGRPDRVARAFPVQREGSRLRVVRALESEGDAPVPVCPSLGRRVCQDRSPYAVVIRLEQSVAACSRAHDEPSDAELLQGLDEAVSSRLRSLAHCSVDDTHAKRRVRERHGLDDGPGVGVELQQERA